MKQTFFVSHELSSKDLDLNFLVSFQISAPKMSAAPASPDDEDVSEDMHQPRRGPAHRGHTLTGSVPVMGVSESVVCVGFGVPRLTLWSLRSTRVPEYKELDWQEQPSARFLSFFSS